MHEPWPVHDRRSLFGERRNCDNVFAELRRRNRGPAAQRTPPGPYVTISVGGPLDGIVTLTSRSPRVVVEARWGGGDDARDGMSLTRSGEREALILAGYWANQLIDGHEPTRDLLRLPKHS